MIESDSNALRLAQAHFNRMDFAGTPATATMRAALSKLLVDLDANIGLSKFARIVPFIGGTAATHALELFGNDITWGGTVTHDANGSRGNASTGTGTLPIDILNDLGTANSFSVYMNAITDTDDTYPMGAFVGTPSRRYYLGNIGPNCAFAPYIINFTTDYSPPNSESVAMIARFAAGSVTSGKVATAYFDGVAQTSGVAATGSAPPSTHIGIFAIYNSDTTAFSNHTDARFAFMHMGDELTAGEHTSLYNAVEAYQVALSREN